MICLVEYCCEDMKYAARKNVVDYCPEHLTTIDILVPRPISMVIYFCPFCGKKFENYTMTKIKKYIGKPEKRRR